MKLEAGFFEAVTGIKADTIEVEGNTVFYHLGIGMGEINVYEFAHMCKERAISYAYIIQSEYEGNNGDVNYAICRIFFDGDEVWNNYDDDFDADSEPEAVIKAAKWVYDRKEK